MIQEIPLVTTPFLCYSLKEMSVLDLSVSSHVHFFKLLVWHLHSEVSPKPPVVTSFLVRFRISALSQSAPSFFTFSLGLQWLHILLIFFLSPLLLDRLYWLLLQQTSRCWGPPTALSPAFFPSLSPFYYPKQSHLTPQLGVRLKLICCLAPTFNFSLNLLLFQILTFANSHETSVAQDKNLDSLSHAQLNISSISKTPQIHPLLSISYHYYYPSPSNHHFSLGNYSILNNLLSFLLPSYWDPNTLAFYQFLEYSKFLPNLKIFIFAVLST